MGYLLGNCWRGGAISLDGNRRVAIWGQSNAVGRAEITDISADPLASSDPGLATLEGSAFERVFIWDGSAYSALEMGANNIADAGQFGPEFGLAVRWTRETTTGNLYIEKEASSGVSITYFDPAGIIYPGMVTRRSAADAWLSGQGVTLDSDGLLWVQGEADAGETETWYRDKFDTLMTAAVDDGFLSSSEKQVLAQINATNADYGAGVADAKTAYVTNNPTIAALITYANYLKADNLHLNGRGQVQLGYDAFEKLFAASHVDA